MDDVDSYPNNSYLDPAASWTSATRPRDGISMSKGRSPSNAMENDTQGQIQHEKHMVRALACHENHSEGDE